MFLAGNSIKATETLENQTWLKEFSIHKAAKVLSTPELTNQNLRGDTLVHVSLHFAASSERI